VIAASRDDTLPALGAVQLTFTGDAVTMVATDRYRAGLRRLPWRPSGGQLPPPVLIPAPALGRGGQGGRRRPGQPARARRR
jgi:DNA polymerase III subunit beta